MIGQTPIFLRARTDLATLLHTAIAKHDSAQTRNSEAAVVKQQRRNNVATAAGDVTKLKPSWLFNAGPPQKEAPI
ncbi:hypothetical protein WJ977_17545 [Achromobacter xylosoxidans]